MPRALPDTPAPAAAPPPLAGLARRGGPAWGALLLALAVLGSQLAGCSSAPPRRGGGGGGGSGGTGVPRVPINPDRDGPGLNPPPDLDLVPDAEPRVEPLRSGGPNKPYEVLGQRYTPLQGDVAVVERGGASWYGRKFHGRPTATGEPYDMYAMSAAHKTMPLPSYAKVRNPANGREVVVRVNDRGPFHGDRVIDLSYTAALRLGLLGGVAPVEVERLTHEAIRNGSWRPPDAATGLAALPARVPAHLASAAGAAPAASPPPVTGPAVLSLPEPAGGVADPIAALAAVATPVPLSPMPQAVPLEPPARPAQTDAPPASEAGIWLQLGAFREAGGAALLQQRLQRETSSGPAPLPGFTVRREGDWHRLQVGPFSSRAEALAAAERLRNALPGPPLVVERR